MKKVSINKFKTPAGTIYAVVGECFADCLRVSNRICPADDRETLGSYIQGETNCEAFFNFIQGVDVISYMEI